MGSPATPNIESGDVDLPQLGLLERKFFEFGTMGHLRKLREQLFETIHDSKLGVLLSNDVDRRLESLNGRVGGLVGLSKFANNIALCNVQVCIRNFNTGDSDLIERAGGMCFEAASIAEVTAHLMHYRLAPRERVIGGFTQIVCVKLRSKTDGNEEYHAVLKLDQISRNGASTTRFCDPINGVEDTWDRFVSGEAYLSKDSAPAYIVGSLDRISL
ncbi:TPA: hypothetical protein DCY43_00450 [candidate division WWE3 bacterium]|uniref:Uncharacterized protein n=3 Tax=Katanobacteria TaxID=422282 RepID=A0A0G1MV52_UNCKA|nr:MAG: hypothetical protein UW65_C0003G0003 [candidate division WWE3 bacterium GW2011_GWB1_44_4]KKT84627.1 MAG: hypothetical protein UW82_C0015G0005 [candidate division WWE3 bacterium GW2011_GWC2_44_9]HAZ29212.1 hypothetical protein [candidate division WWE3 bacterium]